MKSLIVPLAHIITKLLTLYPPLQVELIFLRLNLFDRSRDYRKKYWFETHESHCRATAKSSAYFAHILRDLYIVLPCSVQIFNIYFLYSICEQYNF